MPLIVIRIIDENDFTIKQDKTKIDIEHYTNSKTFNDDGSEKTKFKTKHFGITFVEETFNTLQESK